MQLILSRSEAYETIIRTTKLAHHISQREDRTEDELRIVLSGETGWTSASRAGVGSKCWCEVRGIAGVRGGGDGSGGSCEGEGTVLLSCPEAGVDTFRWVDVSIESSLQRYRNTRAYYAGRKCRSCRPPLYLLGDEAADEAQFVQLRFRKAGIKIARLETSFRQALTRQRGSANRDIRASPLHQQLTARILSSLPPGDTPLLFLQRRCRQEIPSC